MERTILSNTVKLLRKEYNLTQEDLAIKSGVGLCFVRSLEQGKSTLRMDKVNQLLNLFNYELTPTKKSCPFCAPVGAQAQSGTCAPVGAQAQSGTCAPVGAQAQSGTTGSGTEDKRS